MRIRKKIWNNDAEPIIVIMVVLMVLGTINVFSSSFVLGTTDYENPYHFLRRHAIVMAVGLLLFFVFMTESTDLMIVSYEVNKLSPSILRFPLFIPQSALVIGSFLLELELIRQLLDDVCIVMGIRDGGEGKC